MATVAVDATSEKAGYISWGAAIAGALIASALSFVLLTFGSAVGLSLVSPWTSTASSAKWAGALAVFWIVAQQIGSFLAGGYVAGRMRTRWHEAAKRDEIEFRDGLHGALVWAIGAIIGAMLAASVASSVVSTAASAVGKAAEAAASQADPLSYQVDVLFRPTGQNPASGPASSDPNATKAEVLRVVANAVAAGGISPADKTYLSQLVAQRTGLPPQEAEARVTQVYNEAARITKDVADKARKSAVAAGFLTAASLLLSLAAAWWGAQHGGHHRDTGRAARFY